MSKSIFEVNWNDQVRDRVVVSANTSDNYVNIGVKDSTVDRAAFIELNTDQQLELALALLENLKRNGILK